MIEQIGNLWDFHRLGEWVVITTNGYVKRDGSAVMGRGCALECKNKFPGFDKQLGHYIRSYGNLVFPFHDQRIITFPVKHKWWEIADLYLIESGLQQLYFQLENLNINKIYMPKPGCGNGKLNWESQVKPLCEKYLDDRFIVVDK